MVCMCCRLGDDDPRCGPASLQKFEGEDLGFRQRAITNGAADRACWAEQQAQQEAATKKEATAAAAAAAWVRERQTRETQKYEYTTARIRTNQM